SQPGHSAWTAIYHGTAANPSAINWAGTIANTNNWLWRAFHYARQYAPEGASLFYNDYNEFDPAKRDYIINNILIPLRERGIIDGMGMQGHISANPDGNSWSGWTRFQTAMDRYAATGLQVQITELDITLETLESGGTRWTPAQQATYYERIFNHAITINSRNGGKVTAICMWGPNDANSWITRRTGRERCAPLLHDGTNTRKPAYNSVAAIVPQSQWGDGKNPNFSWENNGGAPILPDERGYFFHTTFEGSTTSLDGWAARGAATVTNSGTRAFAGTRSAAVTTRTSAWHGIQRELNPRAFVPGNAYGFSAMAMFRDTASTTNQVFALTMNYTDTAGDSRFTRIASAEAAPNEWVRLLNPNFLIPSGARNIFIYIEMVDSTVDFFVDELIGALPNILIPREWVWCLSEATQSEVSDGANAHDVVFSRWGTNTGITLTPQKTLVVSPRPGQTDAAVFNFSQAGMNISTTNYKIHMAGNFSPAAGNFRIQGIVGGPGTGSAVAGALEFTDNVARLHNVSLASGRFDVELTIGPNAEIRPGPYTASSITGNLTALRMHTNANGAGSAITFDTFRVTETSASAPTFTVTFDPNGGTRTGGGQLSQTVAQNSAATAPVLTRQNWVFNGWNSAFNAVTANTTVTAQWLRLGAVSSDGTGTVTSADAVWLARSLAGHTGFSLPASGALREIADINRDGQVNSADLTALVRWLVGYGIN
ncbi:MAG: endo-1,4-beta-xylanase, partial [Defluviitaleaceae bacterium]|nr:endo-1,4-beta-xylanase [Defluviitaleaceae bacterium]